LTISCALDERWPFGGTALQSFELGAEALSIRLELRNEDRTMPGALGFHPWFRTDVGRGPLELEFLPAARLAPGPDGFPRHRSEDLGDRPWDDVFVGLAAPPLLAWPGGPRLRIRSTSDVWVVFERQRNSLCVEPLTAPPDSVGSAKASIVGPGHPLSLTMRLEWGAVGSVPRAS
jgi:aldose 1-epimerase